MESERQGGKIGRSRGLFTYSQRKDAGVSFPSLWLRVPLVRDYAQSGWTLMVGSQGLLRQAERCLGQEVLALFPQPVSAQALFACATRLTLRVACCEDSVYCLNVHSLLLPGKLSLPVQREAPQSSLCLYCTMDILSSWPGGEHFRGTKPRILTTTFPRAWAHLSFCLCL